ncbi:hypothetical protein ASC92_15990 [Variovorax sp. Root411]|nr:hypothetical protein ASC92_15990 [Variovorax sp. Root411]
MAVAAALLAPAAANAQSSTWPARPVTVVVPFPPGGVTDITARVIAHQLEKKFGVAFVIDNRGGAGGNIGAAAVARAPADGYTVLYATQGVLTANPFLYKKPGFDVKADFVPVGLTYENAHVLTVNPEVPAKTAPELVGLAKSKPGKLNYGSSGVGGGSHLFMAYFQYVTGTEMLHVPYKGGGAAMTDLMAGRVDAMLDSIPSAAGQIKAGSLRALGVSGSKRDPQLPDVPTLAEAGIKGFEAVSWGAIMVPAKTPPDILVKFSQGLKEVMASAETQKMLADKGATGVPSTAAQAQARIDSETARWSAVIKSANITAD